ncbi:cupin domain-containing protein [Fluviibacterium sp. DFM31]|uniref:Cupin domain-containing protein n=1 Tax=Meridianimarinicoccus marinus TaxID=3231483 RepID=A0ABV3L7Q1_9RHOB
MSGETYVLNADAGRVLAPEKQPAVEMARVEGMNFSYGVLADLPDAGVTFARGVVPPGKEVPAHAGPNLYALLVLSGTGRLTLFDDAQRPTGALDFAPGTLVVFPPGAQHGWINDSDADFVWFGVDLPDRSG